MKYFIDTEFHEYKKQSTVCGVKVGKPIDTIELISIGIVSEDFTKTLMPPCDVYSETVIYDKEYYAICKDFDLKAAWNSFQLDGDGSKTLKGQRVYWLRENVLKPIWEELSLKYNASAYKFNRMALPGYAKIEPLPFTFRTMKNLINKYGKTKEQIAEDIKDFVGYEEACKDVTSKQFRKYISYKNNKPEFYAYYADYDWVVFCWLFGRMIDLPKGFPMYCCDLKQMADDHFKVDMDLNEYIDSCLDTDTKVTKGLLQDIFHEKLDIKKAVPQTNKHNALADARWNKELYTFLINL